MLLCFNSKLVRLDFETAITAKRGLKDGSFNSKLVRLDFETGDNFSDVWGQKPRFNSKLVRLDFETNTDHIIRQIENEF